jgi:hypothetical protein
MSTKHEDPDRFRVNLLCGCKMDLAYGYGATVEEARANALAWFRKNHGSREKVAEEIVEQVSADGTHYEEMPCG